MNKSAIEKIRWWMLRTQRNAAFAGLYRETSQLAMWMAARRLVNVRGVAAVFSRHTHPRSLTFVPGHSDLDLTVVLEDDFGQDPHCIRECARTMKQLGRLFLFTKPEDARFLSQSELSRFTGTFRSPFELLSRPEDWLLIAGREVRTQESLPFPHLHVPRHAEFNRWWENVIQMQIFRSNGEIERGYMRSLYRSAVKNQVHLELAKGANVARPEGFVSDELAGLRFVENPRLQEILAEIKKGNLWVDSPERIKAQVFLEVLNATEQFFLNRGSPHDVRERFVSQSGVASQSAYATTETPVTRKEHSNEAHASVYRSLRERMAGAPEITAILQSAVAYPLPHAHPYIYRMDLVLRENSSLETFVRACEALERLLGRKNFAVAGATVEFALIPSGVYREPLFFLGSGCPFLLDHIHEFGDTVYGSDHPYPPVVWSPSDLFEWCRVYLPYHMVTFRRRLEYGSPILNFCQLASLRIFLESGERLTDSPRVQARYMNEFVKNGRDRDVVESLFRYSADPVKPVLYDRALARVSDTYDHLESLLAG